MNAPLSPLALRAFAKGWKPKHRLEVSEWSDANRMLSGVGSSEIGNWRTSRTPYLREIMDQLSEHSKAQMVVFIKPTQIGGPLALDTPIPTPDGWKAMGDIVAGDRVFGEDGKTCNVTFASEVFVGHQCYRVTFSDGAEIVTDAPHRWTVDDTYPGHLGKKRGEHRVERTLTTFEIMQTFRHRDRNRYAIPVCGALDIPAADLPIAPYLLGAWLANGNLSGNQLTVHEDDAKHVAQRIMQCGHFAEVRKMSWDKGLACNIRFEAAAGSRGWVVDVRELGITKKHIPALYLRASIVQRLELLRGLMDGDGSIVAKGRCEYSTASKRLADDVMELITSLGYKPSCYEVPAVGFSGKAGNGGTHYRIGFIAYDEVSIFTLPRKKVRQPSREGRRVSETLRRRIVCVEPVESVPVRCIAVDSPRHLYLAGRQMIATHNTEVGSNWLGYIIDHAKGPTAVAMPTEKSMKDWTAQKFDPMAEGTPAVGAALSKRNNNSSDNNSQFKKFTGGILYFKTAGSTAELKSTSLRYILADEVDEWVRETPQGDPFGLITARQDNFHDRKVYVPSTPTMKDASRIEELYEGGDMRQYHVPCPHCGELQVLKWTNLKYHTKPDTGQLGDVYYVCAENGCVIEEWQKATMLPELGHGGQARWIAQKPGAPYPSYHINSLYTPIGLGRGWRELAAQWIEAQGDPARLMRFVNTRLGETFRNASSDIKANALQERAEPYALRTVPQGCYVITVGVDTQDNRLEIQVTGHGKKDRTWTLDYHILYGNPAGDELWQALADYVNGIRFVNAAGKELISEACAIDTGGHFTHDVYAFVRAKKVRRPMACKGASTPGRQILGKPSMQDVNWRGQSLKKGVMLYLIGADTAKHLLYNRLNGDHDKPADERRVHFSNALEASYYEGLVAETFNPRKNRWEIKKGKRNEPLDTWCLSIAAAHHPELHLHKWSKAEWERRAAMLEPVQEEGSADVSTAQQPQRDAEEERITSRARRRRGGGFVKGW